MIDEAEITGTRASDTIRLPAYWLDLVVGVFMFLVAVCKVNDPVFLFGILPAIFPVWKCSKHPVKISWLDVGILLVWLYYLAMIFLSCEMLRSFLAFRRITFGVVYYFILRICFDDARKIKSLLWADTLIIGLLCIVATVSFFLFKGASEYVGFTNLYDFRHLYKPLGYLSNIWGSLLIGFLGMSVLSMIFLRDNKAKLVVLSVVFILILFGLVVSFSRGVYISCALLLLSLSVYLIFSKMPAVKKGVICVAVLLPLIFFGVLYGNDVGKTFRFNETLSQQRSISGRVEAMQATGELFKESPLFGAGAGTYSLVINDYRYEDDKNEFTNFAPNAYVQLLTEQGTVGLLIWSFPAFIFFLTAFRNRKKSVVPVAVAVFVAVILIREATFPVFLDTAGFQLSVFTLLAFFQHTPANQLRQPNIAPSCVRCLFVFLLAMAVLSGIVSCFNLMQERHNREALSALKNGDPEAAKNYLEKTTDRIPYLFNKSAVYLTLYKQGKERFYLDKAKNELRKAILKNPHDAMLQYAMAHIYQEEGNRDSALYVIVNLTERFPNKSLYRLAAFKMLYQSGQSETAIPHLMQTIKLSPAILDSPYWEELKKTDSEFIQSVADSLMMDISDFMTKKASSDPILLAGYGKILLSLGRAQEAKQLLEQAIALLPNLMYPRYYLSKIEINKKNEKRGLMYLKQYVFLSLGVPSKKLIAQAVKSDEIDQRVANRDFVGNNYKTKFESWYRSSPILP
jgi:tetratricopeptide (TPR) repeat protein